MALYRKKPVVIEAVQWFKPKPHCTEVYKFLPDGKATIDSNGDLFINTLEGVMLADEGDWIIKGVKGEFYPCKPDIFDASYEPAEGDRIDGPGRVCVQCGVSIEDDLCREHQCAQIDGEDA